MENLVGKNHREVGTFSSRSRSNFGCHLGSRGSKTMGGRGGGERREGRRGGRGGGGRAGVNLQNKRTKICSNTTVHNHIRQASTAHSIIKFGRTLSFDPARFSQTLEKFFSFTCTFIWDPSNTKRFPCLCATTRDAWESTRKRKNQDQTRSKSPKRLMILTFLVHLEHLDTESFLHYLLLPQLSVSIQVDSSNILISQTTFLVQK